MNKIQKTFVAAMVLLINCLCISGTIGEWGLISVSTFYWIPVILCIFGTFFWLVATVLFFFDVASPATGEVKERRDLRFTKACLTAGMFMLMGSCTDEIVRFHLEPESTSTAEIVAMLLCGIIASAFFISYYKFRIKDFKRNVAFWELVNMAEEGDEQCTRVGWLAFVMQYQPDSYSRKSFAKELKEKYEKALAQSDSEAAQPTCNDSIN